ncbi:MAG: response regulator [Herpetosiphon sp.]|nr:response regulator [Herpetosiphon sp.]
MKKILIVDDIADNRELLGIMLRRSNYDVIMARDGVEALEVVERENPALILLDINLPRMNGWEVHKRLKSDARFSDIPVFAITASCSAHETIGFKTEDWAAYISKPFDMINVLEKIKEHVGSDKN